MGESTFIKLEYEAKDKGQRIEIDIVVAAADVERAMEGFYDLMARVKQVGAPAGPERVRRLEGLVGAEVLQEACRDFVLNRFTTEAVRTLGLDTVLAPGVHAEGFPHEGEDFAFVANVVPRPHLTLASIDPVRVERPEVAVEEADVDEQLAFTARQFAELRRADHEALAEGDWALMDVDMRKNGAACKELSGMRRTVEVARGQVPDGFLEGVLGMRAGEMRKVRFLVEQAQAAAGIFAGGPAPEDGAAAKDGAGQAPASDDYVADVTLWEVQQKAVPVIDDAWVRRNLPQFGTVEGFRQFVRADLEAQKERVERQQLVSRARSALEKRLRGSIPDEMYQHAKESLLAQTCAQLETQGMTLEEYCEEHGITQDAFNLNTFMQASEYLRQNLALDVLARELGLEETEEDVAAAKSQLSGELAHLSDEEFRERGFRRSLGEHIRREKALKWLMDTMAID